MRKLAVTIAFLLTGAGFAWSQVGSSGKDLFGKTPGPDDPLLPPSPYAAKPLPELKGVVSWRTLAQVEAVQVKDRVVPQFSNNVTALDRKEVKLQGFMMPLEMGEKQKRFLLVSMPPSCAFCLPGGPDSVVEVVAKAPVKYGFDPIVVSGRFVVLKDDPLGLYYRLTDAVSVTR
jgi:hypothetical protein